MPLDPSISLQVRPMADPVESYGRALQLKALAGQQILQAEQLAGVRDARQRQVKLRELLGGLPADVTDDQRIGALRGGGYFDEADKLDAGILNRRKTDADIGKVTAETASKTFDTTKRRLDAAGSVVSSVLGRTQTPTHEDVYGAISQAAQLYGLSPEEQSTLVRSLPGNPAQLRPWLVQQGMQLMDAKQRFEASLPKFQQVDAGNRVITGTVDGLTGQFTPAQGAPITKAPEGFVVGPDGGLTADPGFVRAKSQIAAAGRPVTNVNVNATKPLINTVAEGLGKQLDDSLAGAQTAQQTIGVTQKLQGLLNSGNLITGPGADARMIVNQVANGLGVGGNTDAEKLANTRQVIQGLAQLELQAGAQMKGQGQITEGERAILRNAAAGQISMSAPELKALAQTLEDRAYKRIEAHQAQVQRLGAIPEAKPLMPFYSVQAPERAPMVAPPTDWKGAGYASKAQAVQDALGAIQRGADKQAVIQRLEAAGITNHGIK